MMWVIITVSTEYITIRVLLLQSSGGERVGKGYIGWWDKITEDLA